jgi:hypothetical protein
MRYLCLVKQLVYLVRPAQARLHLRVYLPQRLLSPPRLRRQALPHLGEAEATEL